MDTNLCIIGGRLVRDPEFKTTAAGLSICKITIASSREYKGKEIKAFVDFTAFGKDADSLSKLRKGAALLVTGQLQTDMWEKDGQKRSKLGGIVDQWSISHSFGAAAAPQQSAPVASSWENDADAPF
jgi:single-strand DNA-binding protein